MINLGDRISRGMLHSDHIAVLDEIVTDHGLPATSPYVVPSLLAAVCLTCRSIVIAENNRSRDYTVENYNVQCCGVTVTFHSDDRVLVDPDKLILIENNVVDGDVI